MNFDFLALIFLKLESKKKVKVTFEVNGFQLYNTLILFFTSYQYTSTYKMLEMFHVYLQETYSELVMQLVMQLVNE